VTGVHRGVTTHPLRLRRSVNTCAANLQTPAASAAALSLLSGRGWSCDVTAEVGVVEVM